ncbi:IclR family transcriptional regulator [Calidifontibacter terrae]
MKKASSDLGGETSQTMDRGLAVLRVLADAENTGGLTVTQLAGRLGVGRPVVYRLVASLARVDLVTRRADGRIALGVGLLQLANAVWPGLREVVTPVLRNLAEDTGLTAHLTVADRGEALAMTVVEPRWTGLHVSYREGTRHPLSVGAAGRAILVGRDGGPAWVGSDGELQPGAHGLAAPVLGVVGLEASVGLVAMSAFDEKAIGPALVAACERIAEALS